VPRDEHGIFHHICIWRGFVLAAPMIAWGVYCLVTQWSLMPYSFGPYGGGGIEEVTGWPAIGLGIAWLGGGFALHARYFWGCIDIITTRVVGQLGVLIGTLAIILGFGGTVLWFAMDIASAY